MIDDAIVVLENIYRYIEEKDCTPREAAFAATKEIGLAVLSITLSLVAVFLPIAFMGGIVGRFLKSFGITMSATILVSMIISFSLTPMLAARWLQAEAAQRRRRRPSGNGAAAAAAAASATGSRRGFYHWIEGGYMALLRFSLRRRWVVVLCVVGMLASMPAADETRPQELPARRRPVGIRDQGPRPGRHLAGGDLRDPGPHFPRRAAAGRRRVHAHLAWPTATSGSPTRGRSTSAWSPLRQRRFDQFEMMNYVRERDPAPLPQAGPADQRQPGGGVLRRRHVAGRRAVHDRRPRHAASGPVSRRR